MLFFVNIICQKFNKFYQKTTYFKLIFQNMCCFMSFSTPKTTFRNRYSTIEFVYFALSDIFLLYFITLLLFYVVLCCEYMLFYVCLLKTRQKKTTFSSVKNAHIYVMKGKMIFAILYKLHLLYFFFHI